MGESPQWGFPRCLHLGPISELSFNVQHPNLVSPGLKRSRWPEVACSLCQSLCQSVKNFSTGVKKLSVHQISSAVPAQPGPAAPNWGFLRVPNHSWHLPGRPSGISLALRQHITADPETLTQHPGNASWQTLRH